MVKVLTRQERREQTREQLLGAAARVFARRGYHDASVEEIAAEAGFSTGAVYSNFAGKEQLFLALADREVERRTGEIVAIADAAEAGGDPALEAGRQFQQLLERDPDWPVLFYEFWSYGVRNAAVGEEFATRRAAVQDALAETLERLAAQYGFQLRFPAPALATAINAALNGLAFERAADPESLPDEVLAEFVSAVLACSVTIEEHT